jgi:hypothetical protein
MGQIIPYSRLGRRPSRLIFYLCFVVGALAVGIWYGAKWLPVLQFRRISDSSLDQPLTIDWDSSVTSVPPTNNVLRINRTGYKVIGSGSVEQLRAQVRKLESCIGGPICDPSVVMFPMALQSGINWRVKSLHFLIWDIDNDGNLSRPGFGSADFLLNSDNTVTVSNWIRWNFGPRSSVVSSPIDLNPAPSGVRFTLRIDGIAEEQIYDFSARYARSGS